MYGSASAAKRWENTLHPWLESIGFEQGKNERCVFYHEERKILVITYVDDLLVRSGTENVEWFFSQLKKPEPRPPDHCIRNYVPPPMPTGY